MRKFGQQIFLLGGTEKLMSTVLKSRQDAKILLQYCTDKGRRRKKNEDYCGYYIPEDQTVRDSLGSLFAISDGVGGSRAGEVASAEAVNVLLQEYYFGDYPERVPERLNAAYEQTALHLYDLAERAGSCNKMSCTLTALLLKDDKFYITHIGDSKAFLLRNGHFIQLTKDHSLVGAFVRMGFLTREQARIHPNRHVLLRSLGEQPILPPDFYSGNILENDRFFLTTDGIFEHLSEKEIRDFLMNMKSGSEGIEKLVETANRRGGMDNMTVMLIVPV